MQAPPTPEGEQRKPAAHRWKPEVKKTSVAVNTHSGGIF